MRLRKNDTAELSASLLWPERELFWADTPGPLDLVDKLLMMMKMAIVTTQSAYCVSRAFETVDYLIESLKQP